MKSIQYQILFVFLFVFSQSYSQKFRIAEIPDWVVPVEKKIESSVSKYDVNSGAYTSLYDCQINIGIQSDFNHFITNVVTSAGITSASEIYISYDTSYQDVVFHYLYIWRDGEIMDRTNDVEFEILKNEQYLQNGIYTGMITAYEILEDIRKDDRIEYAYTINGDNPIYDHKLFRILPMEDTNPIDYFYVRVQYPKDMDYYYQCQGCNEMNFSKSVIGMDSLYEISRSNLPAKEIEESAPAWHIPYNYFAISGFENWEDVNEWACSIFALDHKPNFDQTFEEIFNGNESIEQKIDAIINYVQNDIRYMGIESGIGSIKPFPPDQVIKQRYGDCKDKSLLLATMFREIGVENCYPTLVNSSITHGLNQLLPGGQWFDHCIVYYTYEGNEYWLDPTMSLQGGNFKNKSNFDYGKALIVREGEKNLVDMGINDSITRSEVDEYITINSFDEAGILKVETRLYGLKADIIRSYLEYFSLKELSDQFKESYSALYPSIAVDQKLKIQDDMENNILTIFEQYSIANLWQDVKESIFSKSVFQFEPVSLYNYIGPMSCDRKNSPVEVPFPSRYKQSSTIVLPKEINFDNEKTEISNDIFTFNKDITKLDDTTIKVDYIFFTKRHEIVPEDYQKICYEVNDIVRDLPLQISYPKEILVPGIKIPDNKKVKKSEHYIDKL